VSNFLETLRRQGALLGASVPSTATLGEAAAQLLESPARALAVLDPEERVVGLFGERQLIRCLFPRYLGELRHTAFLRDDPDALFAHLAEASDDPVSEHAHPPVLVDIESSSAHVAEVFLHTDVAGVAVVGDDQFLGMLSLSDFCRALLRAHPV
jgi:CBS domain-containing protein